MFEKEAIIHAFEETIGIECLNKPVEDFTYEELSDELQEKAYDFKKGAEFGYKKANEWHYMKDVNCYEDLHFPFEEEKDRVLIWKVQVITEQRIILPACYHCGSYDDLWYEINAYHVIAWKEILLPKEDE